MLVFQVRADINKSGMNRWFATIHHDGSEWSFTNNTKKFLDVSDFKKMGVVVKEAKPALIDASSVNF
jgi:hypothetical protein